MAKKVIAVYAGSRRNGFSALGTDYAVSCLECDGVEVKKYYLQSMKFNGCLGCFACRRKEGCVQKDEMNELFEDIVSSDFVIFSSPIYNFDVNSNYKKMFERLYPMLAGGMALGEGMQKYTYRYPRKNCMLILAAGGLPMMSRSAVKRTRKNLRFNGFDCKGSLLISGTYNRKDRILTPREKKQIEKACSKAFAG